MSLIKAGSTDAFVVVDLDDADTAAGIVRVARKVLVDGARNLARSSTYTHAVLELKVSGASAAVNAEGDARDAAVAAFVQELAERDEAPRLLLDAGKGIRPEELDPLRAKDDRRPVGDTTRAQLVGVGAAAAASAALGSLDGARVVIEPGVPEAGIADAFTAAGASVVDPAAGLGTECDVLVVGSKVGAVDHELVPSLSTRCLVPVAPLAVTTRALAVAGRSGIAVLPDFVVAAGPVLAAWSEGEADGALPDSVRDEVATRVRAIVEEAGGHPEGHVIGACELAERFLESWTTIPFGRPL